jgi:hypothetical protein
MSLRRRFRHVVVSSVAVLATLEIAYVGIALYLVRSGQVERWINRHPEKLRITFDSAWTVVPGVVHFRNFRIVQQGHGSQLEGVVDRGWGTVDLLELPARRIHVVGLRAEGVEFRLRSRPKAEEARRGSMPPELPPIAGVPWEPYDGPPPGPPEENKGWTVVFTDAHLGGVREVWISARHLRGTGSVKASVTVGSDTRVSIRGVDARFEKASLSYGTSVAYSDLSLHVRGRMKAFHPKETKGLALASLVRARVELDGQLPSGAAALDYYLRNAPWVTFEGGEARVSARLDVDDGRLKKGSVVELSPTELHARFAGFTAEGRATTRLDVEDGAAGAEARVTVGFESYGLLRTETSTEPVLRGTGLRITAASPAVLGTMPPSEFSGRIDLGRAELPQLAFVNEFLPGGGGFRVKEGSARAEGAFDVAEGGHSCKGSLTVKGDRLVFDAAGVTTAGAFSLSLVVPHGDLLALAFAVDGTRLELERFAFASRYEAAGARDWSGAVAFPQARLEMSEALAVDGRVTLRASDTRPLVAFLSADKPLKGWTKKLLSVEAIEGGGRFRLAGRTLAVDAFRVKGGAIEVRARVRVNEKGAFGKALASYGAPSAGIELLGKERDVHLIRPEHWFESR